MRGSETKMTLKNLIIAFIVLMTSQFAISSNEMVNYVCSGTLQIRSDTPRDIENFKFTLVLNTKKKIYSIENLVELTVFQNITNMKVDEHSVEVYESNKGELRNVRFINLKRLREYPRRIGKAFCSMVS